MLGGKRQGVNVRGVNAWGVCVLIPLGSLAKRSCNSFFILNAPGAIGLLVFISMYSQQARTCMLKN